MALSRLDARPRNGTRHGWRIPAAKPTVTARDGARSQMASIDEDTSYEEKRKKGHQKRGCAQGNECPPCQVSCHVHGCYVTQHRDTTILTFLFSTVPSLLNLFLKTRRGVTALRPLVRSIARKTLFLSMFRMSS